MGINIRAVVLHSEQRNIQKLITPTQETDTWVKPYMFNSRVQYLDYVNNIGASLPYCVFIEVLVSTSYRFQDTFHHLPRRGKGKGKDN